MSDSIILINSTQEKFCFNDGFYVIANKNYLSLKNFAEKFSNLMIDNKSISKDEAEKLKRIVDYLSKLNQMDRISYDYENGQYISTKLSSKVAPIGLINYNTYNYKNGVNSLNDLNKHLDEIDFILENTKLIKKILKFQSDEYINLINKKTVKKIRDILSDSTLYDVNLIDTIEKSYVIYKGNKNNPKCSFVNKHGYGDFLNNAMLFEDLKSAKRSATARSFKNYSILEVNLNVGNLVLEFGTDFNDYRDSLLSLTQKQRIIDELEKDDIEMLKNKLKELEEKYPEEKEEKVERKRKM